ncbi:MAG: hypothetical protein ABR574_11405 [Cryomorphaceae bacterium]|nr:hypothetical protein [Flavobacteriales bacterium]
MSNTFLFPIIAMLLMSSCEKSGLCEDDELSLEREDYNGSTLNLDGYYYGDVSQNSTPPLVTVYYLYHNGVFYTSDASDLNEAESGNIVVDVENELGKQIKSAWGVFQVEGSTIEIDRWQASTTGCETTIYEKGEILNDSTFVLTRREFRDDGKVTTVQDINATFKFVPLPEKPDSTNSFIN